MELKLVTLLVVLLALLRSNRTFMELKLAKDYYNQTRQQVLIAPLWN